MTTQHNILRTGFDKARPYVLGTLFVCTLTGCYSGGEPQDIEVNSTAPVPELASIDRSIILASREFDIPVDALRQLMYMQSQSGSTDGSVSSFGALKLGEAQLQFGAELAQVSEQQAIEDISSNIRAAAAVLANIADDIDIDHSDAEAWTPALIAFANGETTNAMTTPLLAHGSLTIEPNGTLWKSILRSVGCEVDSVTYVGTGVLTPSRNIDSTVDAGEHSAADVTETYQIVSGYSEYHRYEVCHAGEFYDVFYRSEIRYNCRRIDTRADEVVLDQYIGDWSDMREDQVHCEPLDEAN